MGKEDFFKESVYLEGQDQTVIRYIDDLKDCYDLSVLESKALYNRNIEAYNKFIKRIACLVKALNTSNNAITASIIVDMLIKRGIFSADGIYNKEKNMNQQILGAFGIDVVEGAGVCRNTACFHSDVLNAMNIMSYPLYCYCTDDAQDNGNDHEGNHVINLIEHEGTLYGYDAFNSMLFSFVSNKEMVEMFVKDPLMLYYKPYVDMIIEGLSLGNISNLLTLYDTVKDNKTITLEEYIAMWEYAKIVISQNDYLLGLFKDTAKKHIREITKGLN